MPIVAVDAVEILVRNKVMARRVQSRPPLKTPIKAKAANEDRDDIMQADAPREGRIARPHVPDRNIA